MCYIAHIKSLGNSEFELQPLEDHLKGTALLSERFASRFNDKEWGKLVGLWHDLGKYSDEFQDYIKKNSGYEEGEKSGKTDHTSEQPQFSGQKNPTCNNAAYLMCAGHRAGFWFTEPGISGIYPIG